MAVPLFKIPLIIASAIVSHFAGTDPNPTPKDVEAKKYASGDLSSKVVCWIPGLMKTAYWVTITMETTGILCTNYPSHPISRPALLLFSATNRASFVLSREYFTGALLVIFGGLLRCSAFRALGPLFTFHLTIKNKHTLVTSGPYAWVRHPGYAGMIIWSLGSSIMLLSRGSLVAGTGFMNTILGRGAVYGVVTILAGINWAFAGRLAAEDAVLQKQFGTEWEEWVKRVPYRLVPWIY